ncbi:hypothetical protein NT239_14920 [Chitinibacter sp. SCUT-21]|uniref:glycosyltransferase n=1 Tax=Chitinibacter sp. SCUT-21 TaxID=2970891 RepID=UPI0035A6F723
MAKILIIEPELSGHHRSYLEWIVVGAIQNGHSIVIGTTPCAEKILASDPIFNGLEYVLLELPNGAMKFGGFLADVQREIAFWKWSKDIFNKSTGHTVVLLPYIDYMLNAISLLGTPFQKIPFFGICMRATFHHKKMGINTPHSSVSRVKEFLFKRLIRLPSLISIFSIDESLRLYFSSYSILNVNKIVYLADPSDASPSEDKQISRYALGLPLDKVVILIYGAITARKGVFELLTYLELSGRDDIHVVLAGKQDENVRSYLASNSSLNSKITQIDRRIENAEEVELFNACDIVWICYANHYTMSGQMIKAAQYNKYVVTKNEGLIGWICMKHDLGYVLDTMEVEDINKSIAGLSVRKINKTTSWRVDHSISKAIHTVFNVIN